MSAGPISAGQLQLGSATFGGLLGAVLLRDAAWNFNEVAAAYQALLRDNTPRFIV